MVIGVLALASIGVSAQETPSRHAVPGQRYLKEYWNQSDLYLQHQAYYMLDLADKALVANPPSKEINLERRMAMLMLDAVTHEPAPIDNPAVQEYLAMRMNRVLEDLDKPLKMDRGNIFGSFPGRDHGETNRPYRHPFYHP